jgi:2-keto-4-pentenoate hydratase/2-oxohepta-3-ene-1,7-dioic acid hydratase in catechol pathway
MRLASFVRPDGVHAVGRLIDDRLVDLSGGAAQASGRSPIKALLLATGGRPAEADPGPDAEVFALSDVRLLPVVPDPPKLIAAPVNYRDHQEEMNEAFHIDSLGIFLKAPSSVLAHGGTIRLPYSDRRFDQEGELALVIGRRARHVRPEDALDHVAGFTCLLDITMRGGEDRSTRKSFDTFTPIGPWLVTPDEVGPLRSLTLRTWVDGRLRQQADVADLIWDVPRLIAYASSVMTLEVGDVITTGTPAGVGRIEDGQRVVVEIDRVGRLEAGVSAEGAAPCPTLGASRGPVPPATVTPLRIR